MQEKENHSNIYRALAVLAMIIWLIISVIALVKPSVFREQEGYYQIDDRILYFEDLRWYEFNGNKWIETSEDIERKERIWSHKVPFSEIEEDNPAMPEICIARVWMEQ